MNRQQFSEYVKNPGSVNTQSLKAFEELVMRYPYCQTGQILFTLNLFGEDDLQSHSQLKKAAAYASDRRKLKELIEPSRIVSETQLTEKIVIPASEVEVENLEIPVSAPETCSIDQEVPVVNISSSVETPISPESIAFIGDSKFQERLSREELLSIVRKRLAEIGAERSKKSPEEKGTDTAIQSLQPDESKARAGKDSLKASLIEKFIREEPKITPPKTAFFNPTETSHRSNMDEEEIISETLAQLYANQGNVQKAIHIYEKLSLLNQEKSRYFAARIQELGKER